MSAALGSLQKVPTTLDLQRRLKRNQQHILAYSAPRSNDIRSPKEIETLTHKTEAFMSSTIGSNDIRSPKEIETSCYFRKSPAIQCSNDIRSPKEIETRLEWCSKKMQQVPTTLDLQRRLKPGVVAFVFFSAPRSNDIRSPKEIETWITAHTSKTSRFQRH